MENNKKLGTINEKELEEITNKAADIAGGTEVVTAVVSAVIGASWALCPSGACTSTGRCK